MDIFLSNIYLQALAIWVSFFLIAYIVQMVVIKYIVRLTRKTKNTVDDEIIKTVRKPVNWLLILIGLRIGLLRLDFQDTLTGLIDNLFKALVILILAYVAIKLVSVLINSVGKKLVAKTKSDLDDELLKLFHRSSNILIVVLSVLIILNIFGVEVGPFLATLGIGGLAIAFALQNSLSNIFGGIQLIFDRTMKVGDVIEVNGITGTVFDIGLRSTRIRTWDHELVTIPNRIVADTELKNFSQPEKMIRVTMKIGVAYGSDINQVTRLLEEEARTVEKVMKDPNPSARLDEFADSALNFKLRFWVESLDDKWSAHQAVAIKVYKRLAKEKIEIPFPQRDVHMKGR